jgi:hypothetical protein
MERSPRRSQQVYNARRSKALRLLVDILFVMAVALVLFPDVGDNPRTGARIEPAARQD